MAEITIQTESSSLEERRTARRQRHRVQRIVLGAVAGCLVFVGLIVATMLGGRGEDASEPRATTSGEAASAAGQQGVTPADARVEGGPATADDGPEFIADDGQTMWASPTTGDPLDLSFLPTGCQMIVALRPADLLATPEGDKLLAALGPLGSQAVAQFEQATGVRVASVERLLVGLRPGRDFVPEVTLVVTPTVELADHRAPGAFFPRDAGGTFVVAPPAVVDEIQELAGNAPPLRREMEELRAVTDDQRHVTVLVAPNFLFNEGRRMWSGQMAALREPLFALLPDHTRAAAVSLHFGEDFFAEVRVVSTIDQRPQDVAKRFDEKIASWPAAAEQAVLGIHASPHSRAVVARLPAMLRALARYVRAERVDDHALLRVYLPAAAGHNLLMAGELMLAERLGGGAAAGAVASAASQTPSTFEERLQKRTTLRFQRDTLETAVQLLSDDLGVPMEILGADLQLDGITKNQSFGLDEQDRPGQEILIAILLQANPDKTATGPADPKQKLVYTIALDPATGQQVVRITTRSQAEARGDDLPSVFLE